MSIKHTIKSQRLNQLIKKIILKLRVGNSVASVKVLSLTTFICLKPNKIVKSWPSVNNYYKEMLGHNRRLYETAH